MESPGPQVLARQYVEWLTRNVGRVAAVSFAILAAAAYLAIFHLPLRADFSHLLPQDVPAVKDLRRLEARVTAQDTVLVVVICKDEARRAAASSELADAIRALPPTLVKRVEVDDAETRSFLFARRHLFVPLDDLVHARDALRDLLETAKLEANPLFIRLDDDEKPAREAADDTLASLSKRQAEAAARAARSSYVSEDRSAQLVVVRTAFARSAVRQGEQLIDEIRRVAAEISDSPGADKLEIGVAAGVVSAVAEHHALVQGMVLSSLVTSLLVALVLIAYFRSVRLLAMLSVALVVGTTAAFGVAALVVGHLNVATAFLGAIIAGNGVNYGILLIARYLDERRTNDAKQAMAISLAATLRPTIIASFGAAIAYGSLAATSFRGFSDFAVIGGVGMLLCWIASYTLLPALVLRWPPAIATRPGPGRFGHTFARVLAFRRPVVVCAIAMVIAAAAGRISYRYVVDDPFEYDLKNLRSRGPDALEARRWVQRADALFGRGIAGQTYIAVDRAADVPLVVDALRNLDPHVIGTVRSITDVVPDHQTERLVLLRELRMLIDEALPYVTNAEERAQLEALRPPEGLAPIKPESLPEEIALRLREQDGRIGLLIGVRPATALDEWDGRALIRFANAVRRIRLANDQTITTSGNHVIYADIISTLREDGPRVVVVALLCLIAMTALLAGGIARTIAVLVSIALGSVSMIAVCALMGIKVTFLDFVALPITLGLGVDYAINIAFGPDRDPQLLLRTSGVAVFVCSLTTMIGYGSLLVSANGAIRGLGLAALIGEVCTVSTALVVVPAVYEIMRRRP
jgi:uncharacterized protein